MKKIKVAVNGYGVIGKRVADAVHVPEEMELSGVCDVVNRQVQERFPVIPIKKVTYD